MLKILTLAFLYGVFMLPAPCSSQTCFGEFCFTKPSETRNFDDARSWCQTNNSTLVAINDTGIQMAVTRFLNQLNIDTQIFINMKLSLQTEHTWFLVNGASYSGSVANQNYDAYQLYGYLCSNTNGGINEFLVQTSKPSVLRCNLCEFEGSRCLSNSTNNFLFNNRCYVKYDNENLTWYKARERCVDNGGDIAQFQSGSNSNTPPFNTSWLNSSLTYWTGIRWKNWSWKSSDDTNEVIYSSWSDGEPNNITYSCVCLDPKGSPPFAWSDCDCNTSRPFVCVKIVPTTTVTTTARTLTASPRAILTTTTALNTTHASQDKSEGLIVGLVLGLAVILPLAILSVILIVWIVGLRRRLRNDERTTTTAKTSQINVEGSATTINASGPDINYQPLKSETMFRPGTSLPLYDQLNQPENRDYETTIENDERATTTAETSQINQERSATTINASDPNINYLQLKRDSMFGPGTTMPLYDQLNQPENRDYEMTP